MSVPNRTILLTGVTGQVGNELYHCLQHLGSVVPTFANGERFTGKALQMDLAEPDSIRQVFAEVRPDLIVNPAAYTAVDKSEQESDLANQVNADGPAILAELAKKRGIPLIHFSTDYVYPGSGSQAYNENDAPGPLCVYGRTKLAGDQAIIAADASYLILRTSWVYGIVGNNFVKTMLRLGSEREALQIVSDQVGSPTSARTLADITCMMLAACGWPESAGALAERKGIYHVTNSGQTTWCDFANEIFRLAEQQEVKLKVKDVKGIATEAYPTPARRPKNSRLSLAKLDETFHIRPAAWEAALSWALPAIIAAAYKS